MTTDSVRPHVLTQCTLCKELRRGMDDGHSACCGSTMTELQRVHGFSDPAPATTASDREGSGA